MRLTDHFTLSELTHSQTADRLGLSNVPDELTLQNLRKTAQGLEMIRSLAQVPIIISSGYRAPVVNRAVGGSTTSQHVTGNAADITAPSFGSPRDLMDAIIAAKIPYDQIILEFASLSNPARGWVHVSFSDRNRRQALMIDSFGTRAFA